MSQEEANEFWGFKKETCKRIRALRSGKPLKADDYYYLECEIRKELSDIIHNEQAITKSRKYVAELVSYCNFKKSNKRLVQTLNAMGFTAEIAGNKGAS